TSGPRPMSFYENTRTQSASQLQHLRHAFCSSPKMRIARFSLVSVLLLASVACDKLKGNSSPTEPSGPPAPGSAITYSVVGASDAIGYGSSKPCILYDDCDGNGYVWVAARSLRSQGFTVNIQQLGIPGAVISRTFEDMAVQYGRNDVLANFIQQEMPFVQK